MRKSRLFSLGWVTAVLSAAIAYATHSVFHISYADLGYAIVTATAAAIVGIVVFDSKAYMRTAAMLSKLVTDRLGYRSCSTGSLCRPHGL